jgi:predicted PhzF superfamily epimerase YddE/YHI9
MKIPIFQVDAFSSKLFQGNPAAVCPLERWLPEDVLKKIASENNLSETAFYTKSSSSGYDIRWFTPVHEADLCGHATLATAFVIFQSDPASLIHFNSAGGPLSVERKNNGLFLDFPIREAAPCNPPEDLTSGLGIEPKECFLNRDYYAVFDSESVIRNLQPDLSLLSRLDALGVCVTAPGNAADFVSRFFAPKEGIPEDPVTGSAHSTLVPFWSERMGKKKLKALQLSDRGGELECFLDNDRVKIGGRAVLYMKGEIYLQDQ